MHNAVGPKSTPKLVLTHGSADSICLYKKKTSPYSNWTSQNHFVPVPSNMLWNLMLVNILNIPLLHLPNVGFINTSVIFYLKQKRREHNNLLMEVHFTPSTCYHLCNATLKLPPLAHCTLKLSKIV